MKKGAVPIPYIIALLLGIAVVAILGYWFFVMGGEWGGEVNLQKCRTRAYTYCSSWQLRGFDGDDTNGPGPGWYVDKYPKCVTFAGELGLSSDTSTPANWDNVDKAGCEELLGV